MVQAGERKGVNSQEGEKYAACGLRLADKSRAVQSGEGRVERSNDRKVVDNLMVERR